MDADVDDGDEITFDVVSPPNTVSMGVIVPTVTVDKPAAKVQTAGTARVHPRGLGGTGQTALETDAT
ncbi:MAG: hypothetical protein ACYTEX_24785, partial [Planctomycetota bacterium]